jgi:HK97 family phage major capsid protein
MDSINSLKAKRASKNHLLETVADRLNETNDPQDLILFDQVKGEIAALDSQIRTLEAAALRAKRATPVEYDPTNLPRRQARRAMKLRSFKDTVDKHGVTVRGDEQAYRFGKFIAATVLGRESDREWCEARGISVKAQTEGVNSQGGVLVPDEYLNTIINLKESFGIARQYCGKVAMNSDTTHLPRRSGGLTAYFVGEGSAPTESTATFDDVALVAKKAAVLLRLSSELAEDAIINVADWLAGEIAYAFASKEDDCLFLGDGTSTYGGINGLKNAVGSAGVYQATGHATFASLTVTDIHQWRSYLPAYALPNAKFYCSQSFFSYVFRQLGAAGGGNTIQTLQGDLQYQWAGTPIVISQKLPKSTDTITGTIVAYYGDMAKAVAFGDRRQVTIKRSDERYFDSDQIGLMGTERFDIVAHDVGTSSVIGPMTALKMG